MKTNISVVALWLLVVISNSAIAESEIWWNRLDDVTLPSLLKAGGTITNFSETAINWPSEKQTEIRKTYIVQQSTVVYQCIDTVIFDNEQFTREVDRVERYCMKSASK